MGRFPARLGRNLTVPSPFKLDHKSPERPREVFMKPKWLSFEDQVRDIASLTYGRRCDPGRIAGADIDGIVENDELSKTLIEITTNTTLEKVRADIVKLTGVRGALSLEGIFARCIVVLDKTPTTAMTDLAAASKMAVVSRDQFAANFLAYETYVYARKHYPFGSAVDPQTGDIDTIAYVPVTYENLSTGKALSSDDIASNIAAGKNVILLGEYGTGKSRCVSEIFEKLSKDWGATFKFPIAVNLRECWGLEAADEVVRRHFGRLGLDEMSAPAVRALNRKTLIFLLDGFDEIGTQSWSADDARLRQLRAQALVAVKDAVSKSGAGVLVTGREHYFSSEKEMYSSLGLKPSDTLLLKVKEEFSLDEMLAYFNATSIDVTLPDWLPRRPLICQTIAQLDEVERDDMFGVGNNEAGFWNYFIKIICKRDARINTSFDADTIFEVFVSLAGDSRNKAMNVGPITQRELQEAFENVVGKLPVEDAAVMLQRLPSLGRVSADSGDRQFIDMYILDGLRAHQIERLVEGDEDQRRQVVLKTWSNPLQPLGQRVLASLMNKKVGAYHSLAQRGAEAKNRTLAADVVASRMRIAGSAVDFGDLHVNDAAISEMDFGLADVRNLRISGSTIEHVAVPSSPPLNVKLDGNLIVKVSGVSSSDGLGGWIKQNEVEHYDSVRTVRRIRDAGLTPSLEILVAIIKKTFFQPGSGRKEDALLRGFASGTYSKIVPRVLGALVSSDILRTFKGDDGLVYSPNRKHAGRMKLMLDELKSSPDPLWVSVAKF